MTDRVGVAESFISKPVRNQGPSNLNDLDKEFEVTEGVNKVSPQVSPQRQAQNLADAELDEVLKEQFGASEAEIRDAIETMTAARWVQKNPHYPTTPANAEAMYQFLKSQNLPLTEENLSYAFSSLAAMNALEPNQEPPKPTRRRSGLSDKSQAVDPREYRDTQQDLVNDIRNLPIEQARERVNAALRDARRRASVPYDPYQ